jgi:hypothetical protein
MLARDRHDRIHVRRLAVEIAAGSIVNVSPSVSQNTTCAPAWVIIAEVEIQECADVMTSSPGLTLSAAMAR